MQQHKIFMDFLIFKSFKFVHTNTQGQRLVNFRPTNPPTIPSNFHRNVVELMISRIIGRRSTVIV